MITGITEIAHITTKQDMSRWTRAHADTPGIKWSVFPGPGGTMIIVEYAEDRCALNRPVQSAAIDFPVASPVESPGAAFGIEAAFGIKGAEIARASA